MARYYLENRTLHDADDKDLIGPIPDQILHLEADGTVREVSQMPILEAGEGLLMYKGEFYIEPLEVEIEFIKAVNAEKWLEGLLSRHVERVREFAESLWVLTEMKGGRP